MIVCRRVRMGQVHNRHLFARDLRNKWRAPPHARRGRLTPQWRGASWVRMPSRSGGALASTPLLVAAAILVVYIVLGCFTRVSFTQSPSCPRCVRAALP